jgi:hypothetical protein
MAAQVANFVLIQDHASRLPGNGIQAEMFFDAPGAQGDDSVLAFRLGVIDDDVKLQIAFNGANLFGRELTFPPGPERSFHELISQTEVREAANHLIFSVSHGGGKAIITDVVLWYHRIV